MPSTKPMAVLPKQFEPLENLMKNMSHWQDGKETGLLATNSFRKFVDSDFPDLTEAVMNSDPNDAALNTALFRDYSFAASSYILEPCHHTYLETGDYGIGESELPAKLAKPQVELAKRLGYKQPLLDYGHGYALYNWQYKNGKDADPTSDKFQNKDIIKDPQDLLSEMNVIRNFHGCGNEDGFILNHVAIVSSTNKQFAANELIMDGLAEKDRAKFNRGLVKLDKFLKEIESSFMHMWKESRPARYLDFRTFIMGIQGNTDIFPNGVIYRGCFDDKPQAFRGETGAQDSIIPAVDSCLGLSYPNNSLTSYLFELRDYRPYTHQDYINWLAEQSSKHDIKSFAMADSHSAFLMLKAMHKTFTFRHLHFNMVKKYIIDNTKYPRATGGTPITTWLPNQTGACLEYCEDIIKQIDGLTLDEDDHEDFEHLKEQV